MLFNSLTFWLFFAAVLALYLPAGPRTRNWVLLAASYVFYGFWDWRFLGLLWLSTLIDFTCGLGIEKARGALGERRSGRRWLVLSIVVNLGVLGTFKYFDFFAQSFRDLASLAGLELGPSTLNVVLPVGISFYTFQTLGYTIDVYRGDGAACRRLRDFALYVAFFPQLVAGPIERSTHLLPQLARDKKPDLDGLRAGCTLVLIGLVKKVVVADNMAPIVEASFGASGPITGASAWIAVYAFALQIYGDFSGYTDIARGVARILGIELIVNFRRPYFATNPREFWARWHISLSQWLRDYLYIPLGGNRGSRARTYRNLAVTMLLGGLWHGAAWMFVVWGALHGLFLIAHRALSSLWRRPAFHAFPRLSAVTAGVLWFHAVCLAWIFFRADSMGRAFSILAAPFRGLDPSRGDLRTVVFLLACAGPLLVLDVWAELHERRQPAAHGADFLRSVPVVARALIYAFLLCLLAIAAAPEGEAFLYFQF